MEENPFTGDCKKLSGAEGYRIRVGNFRIIYTVSHEEKAICVFEIRDRKDAY